VFEESKNVSRREFLKIAGIAGATIGAGAGLGGLVAACGGGETTTTAAPATTTTAAPATTTTAAPATTTTAAPATTTTAAAGPEAGREVKIGYVAPITGNLAIFGVADQYCYDRAKAAFAGGVLCGDGKLHPVSINMQDGQSDTNRASQVAGDLINNAKVDILVAASTGTNVTPVADQAEAAKVPCLSTDCPWQNYIIPRGGDLKTVWKYTYNAFWGTEDLLATFFDIWSQVQTNKKVAVLLPNDALGIPWMEAFKPAIPAAGWDATFSDLYTVGSEDFSSVISTYKKVGAEIMFCEGNPGDYATFWKQCLQQGFHPKVASPAVALAFPEGAAALGDLADNQCGELGWHPKTGFKSALLGEDSQAFADTFTKNTGKQWNQSLSHFLVFDWTADVLKRATSVDDKEAIMTAVRATKMDTVAGPIDFTAPISEPTVGAARISENCCKTPLFGNQWRKAAAGSQFPYESTIVSDVAGKMVPVQDKVKEMVYS
jgi:branched-chain amino acid transport system substrate-binding protein